MVEKATKKILVIDDEPDVTRAVRLTITLQEPQWTVIEANSADKGLLLLDTEDPDLILLDIRMKELSGFVVLEQIRLFSDVPVIMLTVRDNELDKVKALEMGADDYIVKPFGNLELLARIHSVLRRAEGIIGGSEKAYIRERLEIDFNTHRVFFDGREVKLTDTEFQLLSLLAHNAGKVVQSETLLGRVWGRYALDSDYLKVYIRRLRKKIEPDPTSPKYIITVRGVGYYLVSPEEYK